MKLYIFNPNGRFTIYYIDCSAFEYLNNLDNKYHWIIEDKNKPRLINEKFPYPYTASDGINTFIRRLR